MDLDLLRRSGERDLDLDLLRRSGVRDLDLDLLRRSGVRDLDLDRFLRGDFDLRLGVMDLEREWRFLCLGE